MLLGLTHHKSDQDILRSSTLSHLVHALCSRVPTALLAHNSSIIDLTSCLTNFHLNLPLLVGLL